MTIKANTNSTLLRALKTNLPMPNPKGTLIPGARNLSQASIKLMAQTNPIHRKVQIRAMGIFTTVIAMEWKDCYYNTQFIKETLRGPLRQFPIILILKLIRVIQKLISLIVRYLITQIFCWKKVFIELKYFLEDNMVFFGIRILLKI